MLIRPIHRPIPRRGGPWAAIAIALALASPLGIAAPAFPTAQGQAAQGAGAMKGAIEAAPSLDLDPAQDEAARFFEANVRPILIEHCVTCHSGEKPKGDLILDSVEGIRAGAAGESLFESGSPDTSLIALAVRYDDPFIAMPPSGALPKGDVAAIEQWIAMGAGLPARIEVDPSARLRWCFQAPMASAIELADGEDSIDALIEQKLALAGIAPAQEGARSSWLRRVTFDLTGLPPTTLEITEFEADDSEGSRVGVVDRLLASPAYGERQARRWLDLMRYAETKAHEFDHPILNAWQYRDYVIRAFDADVPFDRMVTELLAGDLVQAPRLDPTGLYDESPLGTGAWFLGDEVHSPVSPRGDQADRVAHQVEVLSKAVLGLGVSCARCHDHKFDPITAEDYHALAGFALSTAPRQLRFETDATNGRLAEDHRRFEDEHQEAARSAIASAVESAAANASDALESALQRAEAVERLGDGSDSGSDSTPGPDVSLGAFDSWAEAALGATTPYLDLAIEGFESGTYSAKGIGPWEPTGEAFGTAPLHRKDIAEGERAMEPRGRYALSSYGAHPGKGAPSNRHKGTLTSAPFPMVRPYLHFLINGGRQEGVRVELLDAKSGEVIGEARGVDSNRFRAVTIKAKANGDSAEPQMVRIRVVDEAEGDWGQVGADRFVLSSAKNPELALTRARSAAAWTRLLSTLSDNGGLQELHWYFALTSAVAGEPRFKEAFAALFQQTYTSTDEPSVLGPVEAFVDYAALSGAAWIPNGPTFGTRPVPLGHVSLAPEGMDSIDITIAARPGARAHRLWEGLFVHPDSATRRGSGLHWTQAGRTLVSPGGVSLTGRFAHLVRGKANVVAPIASHKLIAGPLHRASLKLIDTQGTWAWVEQRMPSAKGHHVHFEWTVVDGAGFEIARTVELEDDAPIPTLQPHRWIAEWAEDEGVDTASAEQRVAFFGVLLRGAAELVRRGGIDGRTLTDDARAGLLGLAEFTVRDIPMASKVAIEEMVEESRFVHAIAARRKLGSRLAPAALDLEGRDERVLARGDWQQPTVRAPRGAPAVLRPLGNDPGGRAIADGTGSGRLQLAQSLLASDSKIIQRVWVNRLWQSMFGRGIVATTDDFGAMGASPTHPELLDQLAIALEQTGWSTKAMLRRMALSRAYGRSTVPSESAAQLDPTNALLSHMSVRRLEAEEVRDALLAVSGELLPQRFGRPVPIHLTPFMDGRGRPGRSGPLDGAGRRSIYIEARRNFPHPFLAVFDQPTPSTCHGTRTSANVPAQALAMLNDPFVEERAIAFADSVEVDALTQGSLNSMWLRAVGRNLRPDELQLVLDAIEDAADPTSAKVDVAHVLFNTKEFLFLQ